MRPNELESIPFESIERFLKERRGWIDGVIISGGEPTISADLPELVDALRNLGFPVKLDTNGSNPEVLQNLVKTGAIRAVSMDVKAPLDERYARLAGVPVDLGAIRRSIDFLLSGAVSDYEFRTTVAQGLLDDDDILNIVRTLQGAKAYVLQNFQPVDCIDRKMIDHKTLDPEGLKELAARAAAYVEHCWVRGFEEALPGAKTA